MKTVINVFIGVVAILIGSVIFSNKGITPPLVPDKSPTEIIPPWFIFKPAVAVNEFFIKMAQITTPPNVQVINLAISYWKSEILYTLVKMGIVDAISKSPSTCNDVAASLKYQTMPTCEYMKAGVKLGILSVDDNTYSLTDTGKLVTSDIESGVLKDFTLMINEESRDAWRMAGMKSIQSGVDGFTEAFNVPFWDFHNDHPEQAAQFDGASKFYLCNMYVVVCKIYPSVLCMTHILLSSCNSVSIQ